MAQSSTFYLEIVTPTRQFFAGPCESLILPALDGQMGIEAGHESMVTAIESGQLQYRVNGTWEHAAVGAGFAEVKPDYAILLVSFAERPDEIDQKRAEAAKLRAQERLNHQQSIQEYYHSKAALARAMARLKASRR